MIRILSIFILILLAVYSVLLAIHLWRRRKTIPDEKGSLGYYGITSFITMFLGTFGVSDTALAVFFFKKSKGVPDDRIPGTIIVAAILPVGCMSLAFLASVNVDPVTLLTMTVSQTLGALIGVRLIVGWPVGRIRQIMGLCLAGTAILIVFKLFFMEGGSGSLDELTGWKLMAAAAAFFVFGGLNMLGLGATVPNMAVLLLLGMSAKAVYPVVMTGNIVSCIFGGFKFLQEEKYTAKPAVMSFCGVFGVLLAVRYVSRINISFLQAGMIVLLLYCSLGMLLPQKADK